MPEGDPEHILDDMDFDGVDVQVMHPNLSLFGLYSDDHELSMAHARVYNDYVVERFSPYFIAARADRADAAHRHRRRGRRDRARRGRRVPRDPAAVDPPQPYYSRDFDPVWAAAQANGVHVFIHTQTGGVKVNDTTATTLKVVHGAGRAGQPADDREVGVEADDHAVRVRPDRPAAGDVRAHRRRRARALPRPPLLADRVQRALARVAGRQHGQVLGHRHRPGRRLVARQLGRHPPDDDQPGMAQLFRLNDKWPYPLMPSEYVQRQFHVSFQDDPVAVACRHITGLSTIVWGNDYPHAEGTFRGSRELIETQLGDLPADERAALVGGTLGGLLGYEPVLTATP